MANTAFTLAEIAQHLNAELQGDGDCLISGLAPIQSAKPTQLSFLSNPKYRKHLTDTSAAAVILSASEAEHCPVACLIVDNPYAGYAKAAQMFNQEPTVVAGIDASAVIGEGCQIDDSVSIAAHCVIGNNVTLGADVIIGAGCAIGDNTILGEGTRLYPRVVIYHGVTLGQQCVIHSGVVIGSDGFGMANQDGEWLKIPQLGGVIIGHKVEVGANTTIDRGALEDTIIEDGVKLDNQIQVGHNAIIGANTVVAGCVGISGSAKIGRNCMIGGGTCIAGHITITDGVCFTGMSGVYGDINEPGVYSSGTGVQKSKTWMKNITRLRHLDELTRKLIKLERTVDQLKEHSD